MNNLGWIFDRLGVCGVAAALLFAAAPALAQAPAGDRATAAARARADALIEQSNRLLNSDPAKARRLAEEAVAISDDPEVLNNLSNFHTFGIGGPVDRAKAREIWEKAIAAGSVAAKANLGRELLYDDSEAEQHRGVKLLFEVSKDERFGGLATGSLGIALVLGKGVKQDVKLGVDLLERSQQGGRPYDGHILYLLGRTYQNGWGERKPDAAKSYRYFKEACSRDWSRACWHAGMALREGDGVRKDVPAAYRIIHKGAEQGDLNCMISTAVMLATAEGVAEDDAAARGWYLKAAEEHNSAFALRGLGMMLFTGEGGHVDRARGYAYMKLAAEAGEDTAGKVVEQAGTLPPEVMAEAERFRAEWLSAHGMPKPYE